MAKEAAIAQFINPIRDTLKEPLPLNRRLMGAQRPPLTFVTMPVHLYRHNDFIDPTFSTVHRSYFRSTIRSKRIIFQNIK